MRNKDLTWDYLFSDNFMHIANYAWMPLQYMVDMVLDVAIPAEVKPRMQGQLEIIYEHFWRVIGMPGTKCFTYL